MIHRFATYEEAGIYAGVMRSDVAMTSHFLIAVENDLAHFDFLEWFLPGQRPIPYQPSIASLTPGLGSSGPLGRECPSHAS